MGGLIERGGGGNNFLPLKRRGAYLRGGLNRGFTVYNMETHSNERVECPLDYPITGEEFEAAINKLKANKSPGIDNILNEVIKIGKDVIKGHLVNLFNRILDTGKYPALWSFGLIVHIHKVACCHPLFFISILVIYQNS